MDAKIQRPKIFIIDDENISIEIMKDKLLEFDYEIYAFTDPSEAYESLINNIDICDCIILDLMMPKMSGFTFMEMIKKKYPKKFIPIIISSADQEIDSIKKALDLGAYDYFTKPLSKDDLEIMLPKKVKNAVEFSKAQREIILKNEKMSKDLSLAKEFMLKMLPANRIYQYNFFYKYIPYNEIGGDFIDFVEKNDSFIIFLTDISGHGVSAALISSFLKAEFQRFFNKSNDIAKFIYYLNAELLNTFGDSFFCTIFLGIYSKKDKKLKYINAAHPPAILCIDDKPYLLNSSGSIVGIMEYSIYQVKEIEIPDGSFLIFYTDGMYEFWLEDKNEIFGFKRFINLLCKIYKNLNEKKCFTLPKFVDNCFASLNSYSHGNFNDDLLMFVIQL